MQLWATEAGGFEIILTLLHISLFLSHSQKKTSLFVGGMWKIAETKKKKGRKKKQRKNPREENSLSNFHHDTHKIAKKKELKFL
jgi:hypothetical protein